MKETTKIITNETVTNRASICFLHFCSLIGDNILPPVREDNICVCVIILSI